MEQQEAGEMADPVAGWEEEGWQGKEEGEGEGLEGWGGWEEEENEEGDAHNVEWVESFMDILVGQLGNLPPRPFIVAANSLAKLPPSCLRYEHAVRLSQLLFARTAAYCPHDLVNALCTLARLEIAPSAEWMVARMMDVARLLPKFKPDEASLFLYACARLKYRPGDVLLRHICG